MPTIPKSVVHEDTSFVWEVCFLFLLGELLPAPLPRFTLACRVIRYLPFLHCAILLLLDYQKGSRLKQELPYFAFYVSMRRECEVGDDELAFYSWIEGAIRPHQYAGKYRSQDPTDDIGPHDSMNRSFSEFWHPDQSLTEWRQCQAQSASTRPLFDTP